MDIVYLAAGELLCWTDPLPRPRHLPRGPVLDNPEEHSAAPESDDVAVRPSCGQPMPFYCVTHMADLSNQEDLLAHATLVLGVCSVVRDCRDHGPEEAAP